VQVVLVYLQTFRRNSLLKSTKNCEKFTKNRLLGVHGRSRSLMLINLNSQSTVLVMISSMFVPLYNRFHTKRANSGKITSF